MNKLNMIVTACAAAALVACGGGGGGGDSTPVASVNTSQFIDSPVQGLHYLASPSGETGTTDASGNFTFKDGDTVSFKIGGSSGLEIASTAPTKDTPVLVTDFPAAVQIAQILQSLDLGGDANTKLDLSQIKSLPATTVTALKAHIDGGGDLTTGQTLLATAQTAIQAANSDLASKTFPTPKSEADINTHLIAATSKLPAKIPAIENKAFLVVGKSDTSNPDWALIGFKDGKVKHLGTDLGVATGAYTKSGDALTITFDSYTNFGSTTPAAVNCIFSSKFSKFDNKVPGAFSVNTSFSGAECADPAEVDTFVAIDKSPALEGFKGKTFKFEAIKDLTSGDACGPLTWTFGSDISNLTLTSTTTNTRYSCTGVKFGGASSTPAATFKALADAPYIFTADVDYGSNLKGRFYIMKIAGLENTAVLMWAGNFEPPQSAGTMPAVGDWRIRNAVAVKVTKQ